MKEGKAPLGGDAYGKFRQRQKLAKIVYHVCQTLEENWTGEFDCHILRSPRTFASDFVLSVRGPSQRETFIFFFIQQSSAFKHEQLLY